MCYCALKLCHGSKLVLRSFFSRCEKVVKNKVFFLDFFLKIFELIKFFLQFSFKVSKVRKIGLEGGKGQFHQIFTRLYPKTQKRLKAWLYFLRFGICAHKSFELNVDEIDPRLPIRSQCRHNLVSDETLARAPSKTGGTCEAKGFLELFEFVLIRSESSFKKLFRLQIWVVSKLSWQFWVAHESKTLALSNFEDIHLNHYHYYDGHVCIYSKAGGLSCCNATNLVLIIINVEFHLLFLSLMTQPLSIRMPS
jgi:hypothetical protein